MQSIGTIECLAIKRTYIAHTYTHLSYGAMIIAGQRPEIVLRGRHADYKETFSGHNRAAAHINSQQFLKHALKLCKSEPDQILAWRGELRPKSYPSCEVTNNCYLLREGTVSSKNLT